MNKNNKNESTNVFPLFQYNYILLRLKSKKKKRYLDAGEAYYIILN